MVKQYVLAGADPGVGNAGHILPPPPPSSKLIALQAQYLQLLGVYNSTHFGKIPADIAPISCERCHIFCSGMAGEHHDFFDREDAENGHGHMFVYAQLA